MYRFTRCIYNRYKICVYNQPHAEVLTVFLPLCRSLIFVFSIFDAVQNNN